jgi:hypothetical protein
MVRQPFIVSVCSASFILLATLCGCGGSGRAPSTSQTSQKPSGVIRLNPSGTQAAPTQDASYGPFQLTAKGQGYSGNFTLTITQYMADWNGRTLRRQIAQLAAKYHPIYRNR